MESNTNKPEGTKGNILTGTITGDFTLEDIVQLGNRISTDCDRLEKMIWAAKAESIAQLDRASQAYLDASTNGGLIDEKVQALQDATVRYLALGKLWSQTVGLRNRAAHFSDLPSRGPAWDALSEVFDRIQSQPDPK